METVIKNTETCTSGTGKAKDFLGEENYTYQASVCGPKVTIFKRLESVSGFIVVPLMDWDLVVDLVATARLEHARTLIALSTHKGGVPVVEE